MSQRSNSYWPCIASCWRALCLGGLLGLLSAVAHASAIEVQGLLKNAAVIVIDGVPVMLRAGESRGELTLISANSREAVVEINGRRQTLGISERISTEFAVAAKREVAIARNARNAYTTYASINGQRFLVLLDTGASQVAMNSGDARRLGINYQQGEPLLVSTASGRARAYQTRLRSIDVGGITVSGVPAMVIEGDFPETVLLGMTYLQHVELREAEGVLYLQSSF